MIFFVFWAFGTTHQNNIIHSIQLDAQKITDIDSALLSTPQEQRIPEFFHYIEKLDKNIVRLEELYKNPK